MDKGPMNRSVGMITNRKCPLCGHHEVGFMTQDGSFHPLKPGTIIQVMDQGDTPVIKDHGIDRVGPMVEDESIPLEKGVWVPDPLRGDPKLRMKYGVIFNKRMVPEAMSPEVYQEAYLLKLEQLIEREKDVPLPVFLDRFFCAPHLADSNPKRAAQIIFQELDEIQDPVQRIREWLEKEDDESLSRLIAPISPDDLEKRTVGDEDLLRELQELSLVDFFEML